MMEMIDAAEALEAMYKHERDMQTFSESKGYDNIAAQYREKAEALRAARAVLEGLEHHRAKAADVARAIRICRGEILSDDCGECPYYEDCRDGTHKLDLDIESLLVEVCLQGGDCDESTCRM